MHGTINAHGNWGMNQRVLSVCFMVASILSPTAFSESFARQYKGLPYHDSRYSGGPQKLPGKVLCAHYDLEPIQLSVTRNPVPWGTVTEHLPCLSESVFVDVVMCA